MKLLLRCFLTLCVTMLAFTAGAVTIVPPGTKPLHEWTTQPRESVTATVVPTAIAPCGNDVCVAFDHVAYLPDGRLAIPRNGQNKGSAKVIAGDLRLSIAAKVSSLYSLGNYGLVVKFAGE